MSTVINIRDKWLDDYIALNRNEPIAVFENTDGEDEYEYEDAVDALTSIIEYIGEENWVVKVDNFGWRKTTGSVSLSANNGRDLLNGILPKTDCTWKIYVDNKDDEYIIKVQNSHHDSPCGDEWYTIMPSHPCEHCGNDTIIVNEYFDFIQNGKKSKENGNFECNSCSE